MDSRAVTVTAVGDIMLGDNPHHIGRGVGSTWKYLSLENHLSHLKPYLSSDIVIGNLECTLGEISSKNPKRRAFVAPESRAKELKSLGFTHLGIANNHILEHGVHKAVQTKIALEKAGLVACGSINPVFETVNGNRIAIFCYSLEYEKQENTFYKNKVKNEDLLQIESTSADYKIVFIHWGDEYSLYPSKSQIDLAHQFLKRGVTIVVGHHPHVMQGIEKKDNGLIAYSLGNFIFDQNWSIETQTGLTLKVHLENGIVKDYSVKTTRQAKDFVPRFTTSDLISTLNSDISVLSKRPDKYFRYVKKRQNWARVEMKKELFSNLAKASLATLLYPIIRRSTILERILFKE